MNTMEKWARSKAVATGAAPAIFADVLYDKQAYPAAGLAGKIGFFGVPVNQGTTLYGTGAKTYADTNLDLAAQLSTGEAFRAEFLSFHFTSGALAVSNVVTAAAPAAANNLAAQDEETFWYTTGLYFELKVLSKVWARGLVQNAPPQVRKHLEFGSAIWADLATAASTTDTITGGVLVPIGHLWKFMDPGIRLDANTKFSLTVFSNAAVAMPSGKAGIITCELHGERMEQAQ